MANDSDQAKEFEPSQRKLDEARRRGELVRSPDLTSAVGLGGVTAALFLFGQSIFDRLGRTFSAMLAHSTDPAVGSAFWLPGLILAILPLFLLPAALVLSLLVATKGFVFAFPRIQPKLERISLFANAKQKFGLAGWVEFLKSFVKLAATILLVVWFFQSTLTGLIGTLRLDHRQGLLFTATEFQNFLWLCFAMALFIGLSDLIWQRFRHHARLRMSRQEMKDETRESEGDSHLKQRRRQKGYDIATNRMLLEVPKAQVVVVNPSHYAVALAWDAKSTSAPRCVAKGTDELALRIREIAAQNGVPIRVDPPTARALHATVDLGAEILPEHYRAVAAAIRFADSMRQKSKGRI